MNLVYHNTATRLPSASSFFLAVILLFVFLSQHVWTPIRLLTFWERDWSIQHVGMLRWSCSPCCAPQREITGKPDLAKGIQEMAVLLSPSIPAARDFMSIGPLSVEVFQASQISFLSPLQSFSFCFAILNSNYATELYPVKRMCNMHG